MLDKRFNHIVREPVARLLRIRSRRYSSEQKRN
jgi:hypothetical protein